MTENIKKRLRAYKKVEEFAPFPKRIRKPKIDPKVQQQRRQALNKKRIRKGLLKISIKNSNYGHAEDVELQMNFVLDRVEVMERLVPEMTNPSTLASWTMLELATCCRVNIAKWDPQSMVLHVVVIKRMMHRQALMSWERQRMKKMFLELWGQPPIKGVPMKHASDGSPMPSMKKARHAKALFWLKSCPCK